MSKIIINCETGEVTERELNADELGQAAIDEANSQALKAEADARATARQAILDRLGISAEEAQLLLGGN
jgi:hypothetical protein